MNPEMVIGLAVGAVIVIAVIPVALGAGWALARLIERIRN